MGEMGRIVSPETRARIANSLWKGGEIVAGRRMKAKRRSLGFISMNSPFLGCEAHHFNPQEIIHIPVELHKSIGHNILTGKNMERINALAFAWYIKDWT
jgi:hypothetical protein